MKYIGLELENFDKAHIWRKYIYLLIQKYIDNNVLEVGAGIGSFTKNYKNTSKFPYFDHFPRGAPAGVNFYKKKLQMLFILKKM